MAKRSRHSMQSIRDRVALKQTLVVRNGEQLNAALNALLIGKTRQEISELTKKTAIDLFEALLAPTPVDTGRARAGWRLSVEPTDYVPPRPPQGEKYSEAELDAKADEQIAQLNVRPLVTRCYITNNVEYVPRLEAGHSTQAPNGWIAAAVVSARKQLELAVKALRNE